MAKRSLHEESLGKRKQRYLSLAAAALFGLIVLKLLHLQVVEYDTYSREAKNNPLQREVMLPPRGLIVDRHDRVLADNAPVFDLVLLTAKKERALASLTQACRYLSLDSTEVVGLCRRWMKERPGTPFVLVKGADVKMISIVRENNEQMPLVKVETRPCRYYPNGTLAAHVLGYVGEVTEEEISISRGRPDPYRPGDVVGRTGVELGAEAALRGRRGARVLKVNASGTVIGEARQLSLPVDPGEKVQLTLDARLQGAVESLLSGRGSGAVVVLDPHDGAVLAAASYPSFDPNSFARGVSESEWAVLNNPGTKPLFNRFLQATYPPGSTLKIVSAFCALKEQMVQPNRIIEYCTGAHRFGNRVYRCWKEEGHGFMDLLGAIVQSCDSYFFKVAEDMDVDDLAKAAREFGLGAKTGIELPGEAAGLVPDRDFYNRVYGRGRWTQGQVLNNIIGQGEYLTTVLQMSRVAAAVANGGYLVTPHVIASIGGKRVVRPTRKKIDGLEGKVLSVLRRAMEGVVEDQHGTARAIKLPRLKTAGKTGTAQNPHGKDHAWFIGYAPAGEPEIALAIVVENAGHGSSAAAPLARGIYLSYFYPDSSGVALR